MRRASVTHYFSICLLLLFPLWVQAQSGAHHIPDRPTIPTGGVVSSMTPAVAARPVDVWFIPLEGFPISTANNLQQTLSNELKLNIRLTLPARDTPNMYLGPGKLLAERVRDQLQIPMRSLPRGSTKTIYIVLAPHDLNQTGSDKGYVYTAHFPEQRLAIISLSRLSDTFYGMTDTPNVTRARLYKMTKMAIGTHYYNLGPTTNLDSVMFSSIDSRYDLDRMGTSF